MHPITSYQNTQNFTKYWQVVDQFVANLLTKAPDLFTGKISNLIPSLNKHIYNETQGNFVIKPRQEFRIV